MRRANSAFIISLILHIVGIFMLSFFYRESAVRSGDSGIDVQFDIQAPTPKIRMDKPDFKPIDLNPTERKTSRKQVDRAIKPDMKMAKTTAYKDIAVTDESSVIYGMDTGSSKLDTSGDYTLDTDASGAGRRFKGIQSQLVDFVDKSKGKRKIVYCLDVSASMGSANKLNNARGYLKDSLLNLKEDEDSFNIIAFSNTVKVFNQGGLLPVTDANVSAAMKFMDEYTPQGITNNKKTDLLSPVLKALEMDPNIIAMVTDGLPTAGETNPEKILQDIQQINANNDARIFAIGMGMDTDQPEAWLLKAIADQNKGEFQFF
ncbi:VWA domain-containing protein [Candidatus Poribacteria bacterium]|nr:VWA domain-containing protein [Candidatus Poribacteria bacterium]